MKMWFTYLQAVLMSHKICIMVACLYLISTFLGFWNFQLFFSFVYVQNGTVFVSFSLHLAQDYHNSIFTGPQWSKVCFLIATDCLLNLSIAQITKIWLRRRICVSICFHRIRAATRIWEKNEVENYTIVPFRKPLHRKLFCYARFWSLFDKQWRV